VAKWHPMHNPHRGEPYPPITKPYWIMRDGWEKPILSRHGERPMMNAIGLYWALAVDGEGPPIWEREK
jgi:hypothetical protein